MNKQTVDKQTLNPKQKILEYFSKTPSRAETPKLLEPQHLLEQTPPAPETLPQGSDVHPPSGKSKEEE